MITIETVELSSDETEVVEATIAESCSLIQYQSKIFFSPSSLLYALGNLIYIYYAVARVIDPPPCCTFDGTDYFAYAIDIGFWLFLIGGAIGLLKKWSVARAEHHEIMKNVASARAVQAGGVARLIKVSLDEASFFVHHDEGVHVFLADVTGGTRVLDIMAAEDDPRIVLIDGTMKPRDWQWRQIPRSSFRAEFTTFGPSVTPRTYIVDTDKAHQNLVAVLGPADVSQGYDLALYQDAPVDLEGVIASFARAGPGIERWAAE